MRNVKVALFQREWMEKNTVKAIFSVGFSLILTKIRSFELFEVL